MSRKMNLVQYGFRLSAAIDNRPLKFEEFESLTHQAIYVSATPADYELERSEGVVVERELVRHFLTHHLARHPWVRLFQEKAHVCLWIDLQCPGSVLCHRFPDMLSRQLSDCSCFRSDAGPDNIRFIKSAAPFIKSVPALCNKLNSGNCLDLFSIPKCQVHHLKSWLNILPACPGKPQKRPA